MNNRSQDGFYLLWTIAILLCLSLCVFILGYFSFKAGAAGQSSADAPQATDNAPEGQDQDQYAFATEVPTPTTEPTPPPTILGLTADMGEEYQDKLVFLGDSTTYGLASYGLLPFTQVWVPESGTLSLFNWEVETINYYPPEDPDNPRPLPIAECASTLQPEYLIITLGLNGIAQLDEAGFKGYYNGLIEAIQTASPGTRIICNSIYPVVDDLAVTGINNAGVDAANEWILSIAQEKGLRYLNTHDSLVDATGGLVREYAPYDGIHMNSDVLRDIILPYVRTHAYQ